MNDVIVLNYNDADVTKNFVDHIKKLDNISTIIVVDNASTDDSLVKLESLRDNRTHLISTTYNGGYGYGNNIGLKYLYEHLHSKYTLIANPDTEITNEALAALEEFLSCHNEYLMVAPQMLNSKGIVQKNGYFKIPSTIKYILSFGVLFSKFCNPFRYRNIDELSNYLDVDCLAGSLLMVDTDRMVQHCLYDENIFLYCEEIVLGLKCREAGYKAASLLNYSFKHNHSTTIKKAYSTTLQRQRLLVQSKLYVINNYFNSNIISRCLAITMSKISLFETRLISLYSRLVCIVEGKSRWIQRIILIKNNFKMKH